MSEYVGLLGATIVRQVVETIKSAWAGSKADGLLTVLASIVVGVLFNLALAIGLGNDIVSSIGIGFATGVLASVWNLMLDISKE